MKHFAMHFRIKYRSMFESPGLLECVFDVRKAREKVFSFLLKHGEKFRSKYE